MANGTNGNGITHGVAGQFTVKGHTFDVATLHDATIAALLSRGLNRLMGNEVASQLSAWQDKVRKERKLASDAELPKDEVEAKHVELLAEMANTIRSGELSEGRGGERVSPFERECRTITARNVLAILADKGWKGKKAPKLDESIELVLNGKLVSKTFGEMLATQRKVRAKEIEAEANKIIRDREKAAQRAAQSAQSAESADELGI